MAELDLRRSPWNNGYPIDGQRISLDLYRLLCTFAASPKLSEIAKSQEGGCVCSWTKRSFELSEVARLLLNIAATLRNTMDENSYRVESLLANEDENVGTLIKNLENSKQTAQLNFRKCCNKILHAYSINFDVSDETSLYAGHINPTVYLYGEHNGKKWKAEVNIYSFAEVAHTLS